MKLLQDKYRIRVHLFDYIGFRVVILFKKFMHITPNMTILKNLAALIVVFLLNVAIPNKSTADDIFPDEITSSSWAEYGQCQSDEHRFFVFSGGFRGNETLCASTDSSRQNDAMFHLFLECSVYGDLVTYMGKAYFYKNHLDISLTEYRGGTGAADWDIQLERCEKEF